MVGKLGESVNKNVKLNMDPVLDMYGFDEAKKAATNCNEMWGFGMALNVHHLFGAAAALTGYCYDSPAWFRLGVTTEIAEDIIHYAQFLHRLLRPPGAPPVDSWPPFVIFFLSIHHSLGLIAGSGAFFFLADVKEVHYVTFVLLSAVVPSVPTAFLQLCADLTKPSRATSVNLVVAIVAFIFMGYTRMVVCTPMLYALEMRLLSTSPRLAYVMATPLLLITVFNCLSLLIYFAQILGAVKATTAEQRAQLAVHAGSMRDLMAGLASPSATSAFGQSHIHGLAITTSRAHAWAERARQASKKLR